MIAKFLIMAVGLLFLVKGADTMVNEASKAAKILRIPSFIIGLFLVALGTSAPEAVIGIYSGIQGTNMLAVGDVVGSSIVNITVVIGLSSLIAPIIVDSQVPRREILLSIMIQILLAVMMFTSNGISRVEAGVLIVGMIAFVGYVMDKTRQILRNEIPDTPEEGQLFEYLESQEAIAPECEDIPIIECIEKTGSYKVAVTTNRKKEVFKHLPLFLLGLAGMIIGAELAVDNAVEIAHSFGFGEELIGLTVVSFGTSLPEFVAVLVAVLKKEEDIAVGNIVGSNIMNILLVIGISGFINPITIPDQRIFLDVAIMLGASLLLFVPTYKFKLISKRTGSIFISYYIIYLAIKIGSMF